MHRQRRFPWRYAAFYASQFAINAVYQNFSGVYFRTVGFSRTAVGVLAALSPIVAMLTQPLWGGMADRARSKNRMLIIMLTGAAVSMAAYAISPAHAWLAAMVAVNALFYTSVSPLGDTICLEASAREGFRYGPIRWAGTAAFALVAAAAGWIIGDEPVRMIPLSAALTVLCAIVTLALPKVAGHQAGEKRRMTELLRDKRLLHLIIASCAMMTSMAVFYAFFPVYFTEELGGSAAALGWAYFISAMSETPFLFLSDRVLGKLGAPKMLLYSCGVMALRWGVLALAATPGVALASQALHGGCFIVLSYTMVRYVDMTVPDELKASGQMLYAMLSINLARVLGALLGGLLGESIGMPLTFAAACALAVLTFAYLAVLIGRGLLPDRGDAAHAL